MIKNPVLFQQCVSVVTEIPPLRRIYSELCEAFRVYYRILYNIITPSKTITVVIATALNSGKQVFASRLKAGVKQVVSIVKQSVKFNYTNKTLCNSGKLVSGKFILTVLISMQLFKT